MDLKELTRPLSIDQIDFRLQSIHKGGYATILAYKDARVDMQRLDQVVGPLGWKREHSRENHNCIVSVWHEEEKHWVSKEDTGVESNTEQQKGLASDSFKRACFNWGIGRELYDYPSIQVKLRDDEWRMDGDRPKATWKLRVKDWEWRSEFNDCGSIVYLAAKDSVSLRFEWRLSQAMPAPVISQEQQKIILSELAKAQYPLEGFLKKAGVGSLDALREERFKSALTHIQTVAQSTGE